MKVYTVLGKLLRILKNIKRNIVEASNEPNIWTFKELRITGTVLGTAVMNSKEFIDKTTKQGALVLRYNKQDIALLYTPAGIILVTKGE